MVGDKPLVLGLRFSTCPLAGRKPIACPNLPGLKPAGGHSWSHGAIAAEPSFWRASTSLFVGELPDALSPHGERE